MRFILRPRLSFRITGETPVPRGTPELKGDQVQIRQAQPVPARLGNRPEGDSLHLAQPEGWPQASKARRLQRPRMRIAGAHGNRYTSVVVGA